MNMTAFPDHGWRFGKPKAFYVTIDDTNAIETDSSMTTIESPFGYSYIQHNTVGLASFHFDENVPYISYENAPYSWRLDNNQRPPIRKKFQDWSYDSITRSFRGNVAWTIATFDGDAFRKHEFIFSRNFNRIESGSVTCYNAEREITDVLKFRPEPTQDGLVYTLNRYSIDDSNDD